MLDFSNLNDKEKYEVVMIYFLVHGSIHHCGCVIERVSNAEKEEVKIYAGGSGKDKLACSQKPAIHTSC